MKIELAVYALPERGMVEVGCFSHSDGDRWFEEPGNAAWFSMAFESVSVVRRLAHRYCNQCLTSVLVKAYARDLTGGFRDFQEGARQWVALGRALGDLELVVPSRPEFVFVPARLVNSPGLEGYVERLERIS